MDWDQKSQSVDVKISSPGIHNSQYAMFSKKYKELIDDIEFINKYAYTLEFYYESNLKQITTSEQDVALYKELDNISNRYNTSVDMDEKFTQAFAPFSIDGIYEVQNIMLEATGYYKIAYENLMGWKHSFETANKSSDELTIQAAKNFANQYLSEYDSYSAQAQDKIKESLELANMKFNMSINEIR